MSKIKKVFGLCIVGIICLNMSGCVIQEIYSNKTKSIVSPYDIKNVDTNTKEEGSKDE